MWQPDLETTMQIENNYSFDSDQYILDIFKPTTSAIDGLNTEWNLIFK